jgi:hypothetical protein
MVEKKNPLPETIRADGVEFTADEWNLDHLGRFIAQSLADRPELAVRTYGVLADLVYVKLPDGEEYTIEINHNMEANDGEEASTN